MRIFICFLSLFYMFIYTLHGLAQTGVIIHNTDKVDDCYRLISSRNLEAAHLLTPNGRYIHSWHYPQTENAGSFGMSWHYAEMLPNGNLLAIIKDKMIIELDWESNQLKRWQR